jgi:hypothetical protein
MNCTNVIDIKIIVNEWLKSEYEVSTTQLSVELMRKGHIKQKDNK